MAKRSKQKPGVGELLARGKEKKQLTQEDVLEALPEMESDAEQVDPLYDLLVRERGNVVDDDGSSGEDDLANVEGDLELEGGPEGSGAEKKDVDLSAEPLILSGCTCEKSAVWPS
jgi:hypothetical protein